CVRWLDLLRRFNGVRRRIDVEPVRVGWGSRRRRRISGQEIVGSFHRSIRILRLRDFPWLLRLCFRFFGRHRPWIVNLARSFCLWFPLERSLRRTSFVGNGRLTLCFVGDRPRVKSKNGACFPSGSISSVSAPVPLFLTDQ